MSIKNNIKIEKESAFRDSSKFIYFRDPGGSPLAQKRIQDGLTMGLVIERFEFMLGPTEYAYVLIYHMIIL